MKRLINLLFVLTPLPLLSTNTLLNIRDLNYSNSASCKISNDSLVKNVRESIDTTLCAKKNEEIHLNDEAVKQIRFDFSPNYSHKDEVKISPINKPWMDFQVDLAVPKNMLDTTKVRKPNNYIRMLPYSIWALFSKDPLYDPFLFGNPKVLEITWNLNFDNHQEEYGRNLIPNAGHYNPNQSFGEASVVIGDLDFIGFLYDNLNKQGRIRKHNRKHANAWKTYKQAAPMLADNKSIMATDSATHDIYAQDDSYSLGRPGLYHGLKSIELIEEKKPSYFDKPDYRILQTPELRSRFGSFNDPDLYALPLDTTKTDTTFAVNKNKRHYDDNQNGSSTDYGSKHVNGRKRRKSRKSELRKKDRHTNKDDGILQDFPNSMDDLYKYIKNKQQQDSIKRKERFRKDKVEQNVYEYEQMQRKLDEQQN